MGSEVGESYHCKLEGAGSYANVNPSRTGSARRDQTFGYLSSILGRYASWCLQGTIVNAIVPDWDV